MTEEKSDKTAGKDAELVVLDDATRALVGDYLEATQATHIAAEMLRDALRDEAKAEALHILASSWKRATEDGPLQMHGESAPRRALRKVTREVGIAGERVLAARVVKGAKVPVRMAVSKLLSGKPELRSQALGFLDSDAGDAAFGVFVSVFMEHAPFGDEERMAELASEIRIQAFDKLGGGTFDAISAAIGDVVGKEVSAALAASKKGRVRVEVGEGESDGAAQERVEMARPKARKTSRKGD